MTKSNDSGKKLPLSDKSLKKTPAQLRKAKKAKEYTEAPAIASLNEPEIESYTTRPYTIVLGAAAHRPESHMTPLEKMGMVRIGITKEDLEKLKKKTTLDYDRLAKALSVARATLINKRGKEKFGPELSEKIVGLADIYSYGYEVFEEENRFNQWMFRPNTALGGLPPFDLIDNQFGREEVKNLIGRIDYGVYS